MKKFLAIGLLIIGAVVAVSTQTRVTGAQEEKAFCAVSAAQVPQLGNLKTGLTVEQVLAIFPGSSADKEIVAELAKPANQFGGSTLTIRPERYESKELFAGVQQIGFKFLDGKVASFRVGYSGPQWKHVDEFIEKFSAGSNLPAIGAWEAYVGLDNQLKTLKCSGFELSIFAGSTDGKTNYVEMRDLAAEETLKERRAKARAAQQSKP
jgi:hypothetical protein